MRLKLPVLFVSTGVIIFGQVPPKVGNCNVYPADHIWNTPVDNLPVHPRSADYVNTIGAGSGAHPVFGSAYNGGPIGPGIPFITVPGTEPKIPATFTYQTESDPGPYAVPLDAPVQGGPNSTGDRHLATVDIDNCIAYEMFSAYPQTASWKAGSGAIFNLKSYALRPKGWTSADAAGLPLFPGLVRYEEVAAGEINHALRFTVPSTQRAYVWPARHYASSITDPRYPPMGARFRLKASFDISKFPPEVQVIFRALKRYGMIVADNGGPWFITGVPDERWDNNDMHQLHGALGTDFEAVDTSSLMINSDSGQARQTAVLITISPSAPKVAPNSTTVFTASLKNTTNTAVTWSVNGIKGGNSTVGIIDSSGRYIAPSTPMNVTVEATSVAKTTARAMAHVTVTTASPAVTVTVIPTNVVLRVSTKKTFFARLSGTTDTRVTWSVNGVTGGNATVGTITTSGVYTAPSIVPASNPVTVKATSVANGSASASAKITLAP